MSKKMVFQNTDKLFYVAVYTDNGDFSKLSEKGYENVTLANISAGLPEGTPTGELVSDDEVVEAQVVEAPAVVEEEAVVEGGSTEEATPEVTSEATETSPEATLPEAPVSTEEALIDTVKEEEVTENTTENDTAPFTPAEAGEEVKAEEVVAPAEEVIA